MVSDQNRSLTKLSKLSTTTRSLFYFNEIDFRKQLTTCKIRQKILKKKDNAQFSYTT